MTENEQQQVEPASQFSLGAATLIVLIAIAGMGLVLDSEIRGRQSCAASDSTAWAQAEAQKAQIANAEAAQRREQELRLEVIKHCVDRGMIPVYLGGNFDCKASPR